MARMSLQAPPLSNALTALDSCRRVGQVHWQGVSLTIFWKLGNSIDSLSETNCFTSLLSTVCLALLPQTCYLWEQWKV